MLNFSIARKNNSGAIAWSEEQVRYIIDEYTLNDRTLKSIARDFQVQPQSIRNLLRKNNITITNKKKISKYPRNSDYFETIDSPDKAYWVGMLLSDGSITNNYSVNLGLKDYEHIVKFKTAIGAINNKITTITDSRFSNICTTYRLSIRDRKMVADLSKYSIVPNKTYTNFGIPSISSEFIWDFIRGYFDGDGSIYFTNNKYVISFVGNKTFLEELKHVLGKDKLSLCQNSVSLITYDLKICGKKDVIRILTSMYENSTEDIRLDRKYNLAQKAIS